MKIEAESSSVHSTETNLVSAYIPDLARRLPSSGKGHWLM